MNYTNNSTVQEQEHPLVNQKNLRILGLTIGSIDVVIGSIGNLLAIIILKSIIKQTKNKSHKSMNCLLLSLAVVDFITATFMMPFNVIGYFTKNNPFNFLGDTTNDNMIDFPKIMCSWQAYFYYNCGYVSCVHMATVTVNRFIGIVLPRQYSHYANHKTFWISISWILSPIMLFPFFFAQDRTDPMIHNGYKFNSHQFLCSFNVNLPSIWIHYMIFNRVFFQLLTNIVMILCYMLIYNKIYGIGEEVNDFRRRISGQVQEKIMRSRSNSILSVQSKTSGKTATIPIVINQVENSKEDKDTQDQLNSLLDPPESDTELQRNSKISEKERTRFSIRKSSSSDDVTESGIAHASKQNCKYNKVNFERHNLNNLSISARSVKNFRKSIKNKIMANLKRDGSGSSTEAFASKAAKQYDPSENDISTIKSTARESCYSLTNAQKQNQFIYERNKKMLKLATIICATFTALFFPSILIWLIQIFSGVKFRNEYHQLCSIVTWLNSCVNPVIYFTMNQQFQREFRRIFCGGS